MLLRGQLLILKWNWKTKGRVIGIVDQFGAGIVARNKVMAFVRAEQIILLKVSII